MSQRVYGLALGYEDVNDHETLRYDPLLASLVGTEDPMGSERKRERDRGKPLAGKSTLNRLELGASEGSAQERYKKIVSTPSKLIIGLWTCSSRPMSTLPNALCWTVMQPMIRYMAIRRAVFFMGIIIVTAPCRCIFFAATTCCVPVCGHRN